MVAKLWRLNGNQGTETLLQPMGLRHYVTPSRSSSLSIVSFV